MAAQQVKLHHANNKGGGKPLVVHHRDRRDHKVKGYRDYRGADYPPVKLAHQAEAVFANLAAGGGGGQRAGPPLGDKVARYKWYQQQAPYHIPPPPAGTLIFSMNSHHSVLGDAIIEILPSRQSRP